MNCGLLPARPNRRLRNLAVSGSSFGSRIAWFLSLTAFGGFGLPGQSEEPGRPEAKPSHVGRPLPDYVTGDECLFCHRQDIGPGWRVNEHQTTLRPIESDENVAAGLRRHPELGRLARHVDFILGDRSRIRLLKRSERYGRLEMLSALLRPGNDPGALLVDNETPFIWDREVFGRQCAGCHATATDSRTQAFAATGIDCYACHGVVDLRHANDSSLVHLAKKRRDSPELIAATCGQCHVRTGKSRTSGLSYANNHVVGDDLFADFAVDLSPAALQAQPPRERHILANLRDIRDRKTTTTCLTCHNVHRGDAKKHRRAPSSEFCLICHQTGEGSPLTYDRRVKRHPLCGY